MKIGKVQIQLRHLMIADAVIFIAGGLWLAFVASIDSQFYMDPMDGWGSHALDLANAGNETLGMVLAGIGVMFWLLHDAEPAKQRQISSGLFVFFVAWSVLLLGQMQSIWWDGVAGSVVSMYALLFVPIINAVGFGAFFFVGSRNDVKKPDDAAALAKTGDPANAEQP